jgi:hypothetical protein
MLLKVTKTEDIKFVISAIFEQDEDAKKFRVQQCLFAPNFLPTVFSLNNPVAQARRPQGAHRLAE